MPAALERENPYLAEEFIDGKIRVHDKWDETVDIFDSNLDGQKKLARREDAAYKAISLSELFGKATIPLAASAAAVGLLKRKSLVVLGAAIVEPLVLFELRGIRALSRFFIKNIRMETDSVSVAQKNFKQLPQELKPRKL
ncbi:MAG: hypothetical protein ABSE17_04180 [Candidatus Levyibacteriota bacterium]|jgi:hypothetical protein